MNQVNIDELKRQAAVAAVQHLRSGMTVGLGTGSTAKHAIAEIGRLLREHKLAEIIGVATSLESQRLAKEAGISLSDVPPGGIDLAIDGADEIAPGLDLIKGFGGALAREKIVEYHSRKFIVVADSSKIVSQLGERAPVPVEILQFGYKATLNALAEVRTQAQVRLRMKDGVAVISDNGNFIADCHFGLIDKARDLDARIRHVPGVVETGLFLGYATMAYVAGEHGIEELHR